MCVCIVTPTKRLSYLTSLLKAHDALRVRVRVRAGIRVGVRVSVRYVLRYGQITVPSGACLIFIYICKVLVCVRVGET